MRGDGLAQLRETGRGAIVGPALPKSADGGIYDVGGRVEIGFADLEVNNAFALRLESAGFDQNFKSGFRAET